MSVTDGDKIVSKAIKKGDSLLAWYMILSYGWYVEGKFAITDDHYDRLRNRIAKEWPDIKHRHKSLLDRDGSAKALTADDYPLIVVGAFRQLEKIDGLVQRHPGLSRKIRSRLRRQAARATRGPR